MNNKISLTFPMRSNLLNLQQTAKLQKLTSTRLSTGLKVNSAIDNPSSFYTAISLNNRASDLSALLNSMGQSIQTIKSTQLGLEKGTEFLTQASAVATKALEKDTPIIAKVKTEQELLSAVESGRKGFIVIAGDINLTNAVALKDGQSLVGDNYFKEYDGPNRKLSFDFTGKSGDAILAGNNSTISNLDLDYVGDAAINRGGLVSASSVKNVIISNLNLKINQENLQNILGNVFSAIFIEKNAEVKINNDINILTNGETRNPGITNESSILELLSVNLNIKTTGLGLYNHAFSIGSGGAFNALTNIYDSKINLDSTHYGVINQNESLINIKDTEFNIKSASYGFFNNISSTANINNSTFNIKSASHGFYNANSTANISSSTFNIKSASHGFYNANSTANISSNTKMNIELTSNSASIYGLYMVSSSNLGSCFNLDGTSSLNIKTFTPTQNAIRMAINATTGVETILDIKSGANFNINRGNGATDGKFKFTSDYYDKRTTGTTNYINEFTTDSTKEPVENIVLPDPIVPDIGTVINQTFTGDYVPIMAEAKQYNSILSQYDSLINDSSYKGINLLKSDDLSINFNETRTSKLDIKGVDATTKGLGLNQVKWENLQDINTSIKELSNAINSIRGFMGQLGNSFEVITNREEFTKNLINVLTEGADKLVLADMNEESANMLALQTRQQLATNALSLASQAAQSVLQLF